MRDFGEWLISVICLCSCVKLIQYKIENLSLKPLHMQEVRNLKENVGNVSSVLKKIYDSILGYFLWLSPLGKGLPSFIWTNLNSLHPRMISTKLDWNWLTGSGEDFLSICMIWKRFFPVWPHLTMLTPGDCFYTTISGTFYVNPSSSG
jgi:hypothetical protein